MALKLVASHFEGASQFRNAAALYEVACSVGGRQASAQTYHLDLKLKLGHCYLLSRRPDLAIRHFNNIIQTSNLEGMVDRAAIGPAVDFVYFNTSGLTLQRDQNDSRLLIGSYRVKV